MAYLPGHAQSLLNTKDSSKLAHYAQTGVQSVKVETRLFTNKKPDYPNTKLRLVLNEHGLIDTFQHFAGNKIKYHKVYQYNPNQQILVELTLQPNKDTARYHVNTYDSKQNLISSTTFNQETKLIFQEFFKYNRHNHLVFHSKINHKQDTSAYRIKYKYDQQNRIILKSRQDEQKQDITNSYYNYIDSGRTILIKTDHAILGQIPVSSKSTNEQGQIIVEGYYNQEGQLVTEHFYTYSKGNVIKEEVFDTQSDTEFIIMRRFNRKHQIKEETAKYKFEDHPNYKYRLKYNCKGLVKKEIIESGKNKPVKTIKSYYDSKKNCIKERHFQDGEILREVNYIIRYYFNQ